MPAPATSDEFLELVRKSGVVELKRLDAYLEKARAAGTLPAEPSKLAGLMLRDGIVTHFQAEQFLQGKWRRFTIGKYKVLERIASGGMGSVYLCEHKFMRRRAAVKVLPTAKANDPSSLERFYREARAVAALDHPNIVRAYDIDHEENIHFLVMEYVDGSSLQDVVKKSGPLDLLRCAHYISQAALGLQHAHEVAGLVHRDIKPGNLIVDRTGTVKVLDMGLARFFHDEDDLLTQKYDENVLGTADYLAPEQALDSHGVDIRADIYSLGATFYYCLTGRTPFTEGTVAQKLIWHQTRQPKPIKTLRPEVPRGMVAVVEKMMAKEPGQRYQTPHEIVEALAPWTQHAIAPPQESEMPLLSPAAAATPNESGGATGASLSLRPPSGLAPVSLRPPSSKKPKRSQMAEEPAAVVAAAAAPPSSEPARPAAAAAAKIPAPAERAGGADPMIAALWEASSAPARESEVDAFTPPDAGTQVASDEESLCWENLAPDTKDLTAQVDTESGGQKKPAPRKPRGPRPAAATVVDRRRLWWVVGSVASTLVLGLLIAVIWAYWGENPAPATKTKTVPPLSQLVVSRSGQGTHRTLAQALREAKPGAHVIVQDDVIEEQLDLNGLVNISIEADSGKTVTWRCPDKPAQGKKQLLFLSNLERVVLKGFTFEGRDQLEEILVIFGESPDLMLENLTLQGFKRRAVLVVNGAGKSDRPITLLNVRTITEKPVETALAFDLNPTISNPKINQYFSIRNCSFVGPYKKTVSFSQGGILRNDTWDGNREQPRPGQSATDFKRPANP